MDKWDRLLGAFALAMKEDNDEAGRIAGMAIVAEFGRALDRIAGRLEDIADKRKD